MASVVFRRGLLVEKEDLILCYVEYFNGNRGWFLLTPQQIMDAFEFRRRFYELRNSPICY